MHLIRKQNLSDQAAAHLREGFRNGRWSGELPGVWQLARELGVSRDVVRAALRLLEEEDAIIYQGAGKSRLVVKPRQLKSAGTLRIGILLPVPLETDNAHTHDLIFNMRQAIEAAGHSCFIGTKTAEDFGDNTDRLRRWMQTRKADGWIVYSSRRAALEMTTRCTFPTFALGGESTGLPLAGSRSDLTAPIQSCVDCLIAHGHRRIVLICPDQWRSPVPNVSAQTFLTRLEKHGIRTNPHYNLPDWEHSPSGLEALMQSLFFATPPTALLVMEPECLGPVLVFLAAHQRRVPEDVSIVNLLPDPMQSFYQPAISHFQWPVQDHVKRIVQWTHSLRQRQPLKHIRTVEPIFVQGSSIGHVLP